MKFWPLILLAVMTTTSCIQTENADLVVHNARIYLMDEQFSVVEAMAIKDGKVIETGPEHQIMNKYYAEEKYDARTQPIFPGFIDAHCHFYYYGLGFQSVNLVGTGSFKEVLDRTQKFSETNEQEWITGRGWDQNDWSVKDFPTCAELDRLFPDTPVTLSRIDGHAMLANGAAMRLAGINSETVVDGGEVVLMDGKCTGVLIDNAMDLVQAVIPEPTEEQMIEALMTAQENCFAAGLTSVSDAGLQKPIIDLIERLQDEGKLKMRIYAMLSDSKENFDYYLEKGPYQTDRLTVRGFKFYADGALGSRGACLVDPYSDVPDSARGFLLNTPEYFREQATRVRDAGFQMNTHCIGDSANRLILDLYGEMTKELPDARWRIEHSQVIHPDDMKKFRENAVIPSIQPTHATSDMYWAEERLGPERVKGAYAWRTLLEQNGLLALGTDFPVEDINPIMTFYSAVFRMDGNGYPEGGYMMDEALTRKQALKGMTIWAALANFEETQKGTLEPGKVADFVVLNTDLMRSDAKYIPDTKVKATFVNGERVH